MEGSRRHNDFAAGTSPSPGQIIIVIIRVKSELDNAGKPCKADRFETLGTWRMLPRAPAEDVEAREVSLPI